MAILVLKAHELYRSGAPIEEVAAWIEHNRLRARAFFTVDDLKYLKMGGRVSNASALVGSILNIKPVLYVPDRGTLDVVKKARGRRMALGSILSGVLHDLRDVDCTGTEIHILHADCLRDAEFLRDEIKKALPQVGAVTITQLGVVIGAHCGPGLLTIFYLCGGRRPE
jgi:DegV family protein with EDD domain